MTTGKQIAITGNPDYGLAKALAKIVSADFFSRKCGGFDFSIEAKRLEFAELSKSYSIFVNCAALWRFQQTLLLEQVYKAWVAAGHQGHIINLGSTADTPVKGSDWVYPVEKKALRAYSRNLSFASLGGHGSRPSGIRITYLSPGYLNTPGMEKKYPGVKKIETDYVASVIAWLIAQPAHINISELCLDPIQCE